MTTDEAAAYLGVKPATLRGWVRAGLIPHHRLPGGRVLRFHPAELDAAMGLDIAAAAARSSGFTGDPEAA
jgi:excisionase family DNA binding protein